MPEETFEPEEMFELDEVREGQRSCPVCGGRMMMERKHSVTIEVCREHGIWLDKGELPAIIMAVRGRRQRHRRRALQDAKRKGKVSGAFFGWWSLLWD